MSRILVFLVWLIAVLLALSIAPGIAILLIVATVATIIGWGLKRILWDDAGIDPKNTWGSGG